MELEAVIEEEPRNLFQKFVALLMILTIMLGAVVSFLQNDATVQQNKSTRQAQALAVELMGEIIRSGQQSAYDFQVFAEHLNFSQQSLAKQGTALELSGEGHSDLALRYQADAEELNALAGGLKRHTALLSDPRYAPPSDGAAPNLQRYVDDSSKRAKDLLREQNAAADEIKRWSDKGTAYVSVITLLAVALFLFGLSLTVSSRIKYLFVLIGVVVVAASLVWTVTVVLG